MALSSFMQSKLNQTVYVSYPTARSSSGTPTAWTTWAARSVHFEPDVRIAPSGVDRAAASADLIIDTIQYEIGWRVLKPGQVPGDAPSIVKRVNPVPDFDGTTSHYEVYL